MNTIKFVADAKQPHAECGMLLWVITHLTGDIPCVRVTDECRALWVDQVSKIATCYNDAFKVFELADSHAIERMLTAAKERRA